MSEPARVLTALSQALASTGLYGPAHPATIRAVDGAHQRLLLMQADHPAAAFTFLRDEILCGPEVVEELHGWDWNRRLADAGVERLEFTGPVGAEEFARFIDQIAARLGLRPADPPDVWQMGSSAIRFGHVAVRGSTAPGAAETSVVWTTRPPVIDIEDERDTMDWINREVGSGRRLPLTEVDAVVRSLAVVMHAERALTLPLLELKEFDQYTTTHAMNVSVLSMALGEFLGVGPGMTRALGFAGLLHDLGKVRIPRDILNKPGKLTPEERQVIEAHPVEGARMLLAGREPMEHAAVVAYEHHLMLDGGGYPRLHYPRAAQYPSRIVHVCDVYDALRTRRPSRDAWESARVLDYIAERAGSEFDPTIATGFAAMMREYDLRVQPAEP
jgi:putative nucleotidyltransferase with HDIG domain